ncbi:MAG: hypothetical protein WCY71_07990 [Halothiobacillaceae bacterium]
MSVWNQKLRKTMVAAGVATALAFSGAAVAQEGAPVQGHMPELTDEQRQMVEEMREIQRDLQQTQNELGRMEERAYENNPALGQKREALQAKIAEKMSSDGYDAQQEFTEMQEMAAKYQGAEEQPSDAEIEAFGRKQQEFQQRQQQAFQDEEVQSMAEDLRSDVQREMEQSNPEAKELFTRLEQKAREMQQLRQKAMQMQQDG